MSFSPAEQATNQYDAENDHVLPDQAFLDRGCLFQSSPSVLRMTQEFGVLAASFPTQLLAAMKQVIENPAIGIHYHVSHDAYTTIDQLQQLPRQMLYQFALPLAANSSNFAFVQFHPRLSALLTAICFGGSIAAELALPPPGSPDRPTFSRIGKQLLDRLVEALASAWRTLCLQHLGNTAGESNGPVLWLGATASPPGPFTDDCLQTRFDLTFQDPDNPGAHTTIPICFYTPINAFTEALVQTDMLSRDSDGTRNRIARLLGQIDVMTLVDLTPVTLSLDRLRALKTGDILPIANPHQAVMHIAGKILFLGTTGQQAGHLTLQIDNYGGQVGE